MHFTKLFTKSLGQNKNWVGLQFLGEQKREGKERRKREVYGRKKTQVFGFFFLGGVGWWLLIVKWLHKNNKFIIFRICMQNQHSLGSAGKTSVGWETRNQPNFFGLRCTIRSALNSPNDLHVHVLHVIHQSFCIYVVYKQNRGVSTDGRNPNRSRSSMCSAGRLCYADCKKWWLYDARSSSLGYPSSECCSQRLLSWQRWKLVCKTLWFDQENKHPKHSEQFSCLLSLCEYLSVAPKMVEISTPFMFTMFGCMVDWV